MTAGPSSPWRSITDNPQPWVLGFCAVVFAVLIGAEIWPVVASLHSGDSDSALRPARADAHDEQWARRITDAELFGHAADTGNLPETDLKITLRAVFAARDPKQASAVIETADGHSEIVRVGGGIGGGAVLQQVLDNRVVLARNGALETLYFPAPQESGELATAQSPQAAAGGPATTTNLPPGASPDEIKRAAILQRLEELRARSGSR